MHPTSAARGPAPRLARAVLAACCIAVLALAACGDDGGTTVPENIPPLTLRAGGEQIQLDAFVYCWVDLCVDGFDDPPDFAVPAGEPIEMTFPVDGWTLNGADPVGGVWQLDPLPPGSDGVTATITGDGPEGDAAWSVRLVPDAAQAPPTTTPATTTTAAAQGGAASDAELVAGFAAAVAAGDRTAAELLATPNVIDLLAPWEPRPESGLISDDNGRFVLQVEPEDAVECTVGSGQVQACEYLVPGEPGGDDELASRAFGVEDAFNVIAERVQFAPGESGATVSNAAVRGDRIVYFLAAGAGQSMLIDIQSLEDNAVFDVYAPTGELLEAERTAAAVVLPVDGDYQIVVGGTRGNATFDLFVTIFTPQEIRFDAGTSGTTVTGAAVGGEQAPFILGAATGQTMTVSVQSPTSPMVLAVYAPSGARLASETDSEEIVLPETGNYHILVAAATGDATFELDVAITG